MKSSNNYITLTRNIFPSLALCLSLSAPAVAEILLADDFSGTSLAPNWTVQRGYADVAGGYVDMHGSTPGARDAFIQAAVGDSNWTDYHISTHFIADGGGNNWYNALVNFRIQEAIPYTSLENLYGVQIRTPLWGSNEGSWWNFGRAYTDGTSFSLAGGPIDPLVVPINDRDNVLDIWAIGNAFWVSINGYSLTNNIPIVDNRPDALLYGGIGLGAVWESHTRYDYVTVGTMAPVPEPTTYLLLLAGLGIIILRSRSSWN